MNMPEIIPTNSRQMPRMTSALREGDYCDLLYAWVQCNSERVAPDSRDRRIAKADVKWTRIENDFTRVDADGKSKKIMSRKTIAKYFENLVETGLIKDPGEKEKYYYLTLLDNQEANLIEYTTLNKMMNVMQRNSINIYIYLYNRYYANGKESFIATLKQIKEYIGIATTTTSNNIIVEDTMEFLKRLGLLDYRKEKTEDGKTPFRFLWVKNQLPKLEE